MLLFLKFLHCFLPYVLFSYLVVFVMAKYAILTMVTAAVLSSRPNKLAVLSLCPHGHPTDISTSHRPSYARLVSPAAPPPSPGLEKRIPVLPAHGAQSRGASSHSAPCSVPPDPQQLCLLHSALLPGLVTA